MQVLRTIFQHIEQSAAPRAQHPQQGASVQVRPMRTLLRPTDQPRSTSQEARGRRRHARSGHRRAVTQRAAQLSWHPRRVVLRGDSYVYGQSDAAAYRIAAFPPSTPSATPTPTSASAARRPTLVPKLIALRTRLFAVTSANTYAPSNAPSNYIGTIKRPPFANVRQRSDSRRRGHQTKRRRRRP